MSPENDRDAIYNDKIAPLVRTIVKLCRAADIPLLLVFQTDDRTADEVLLTTAVMPNGTNRSMLAAYATLPRDNSATTKTIGGKVAAVETHE